MKIRKLFLNGLLTLSFFLSQGCQTFREVDNNFYRSSQPNKKFLRDVIEEYGIRSVINLRGKKRKKILVSGRSRNLCFFKYSTL